MYPPNDPATCAVIKILWEFHCGIHGYPIAYTKKTKPEWERTPVQEKLVTLIRDGKL